MPKKHNNSSSNPDKKYKKFNFKEITITFSPITALSFVLLILSALYRHDKDYGNPATCEIVVPTKQGDNDDYLWFSAPEHLSSTANYKSLDNGAFVYRHIFMDEFQEEFNVRPIQLSVIDPILKEHLRKHNLTFRLKNETSFDSRLIEIVLETSEKYAPHIASLEKSIEEGTYVDDGSVYIRWINDIVRYGMFAGKDFKPGDVVGIYSGVITPTSSDLEYAWEYNYLVEIKNDDGEKVGACIDSKHAGNYMRFANHKDDNQNGDQHYVLYNDMWNVVYTAQAHIKPNEQIFVDYGQPYWQTRKKYDF